MPARGNQNQHSLGVQDMGKGDRKTAKGKRYNASYGNARSHTVSKVAVGAAAPVAKKTVAKAPAKKAVAKKAVAKAS
ncbi:30S ribosomal protein THX [Stenotrophomonas tumulicola]